MGEDGLAGFSDDQGYLCLALTVWNGVDPILKERLFGLDNVEGNHGEDVKEYYFYLDATPTHSYQRWLYKYPQRPFPYSGAGIGASHQTGWTGLVAFLLHFFGRVQSSDTLGGATPLEGA